jgi:hypothetical protein
VLGNLEMLKYPTKVANMLIAGISATSITIWQSRLLPAREFTWWEGPIIAALLCLVLWALAFSVLNLFSFFKKRTTTQSSLGNLRGMPPRNENGQK